MLSGRYRTESLSRFWSGNKAGFCLLGTPCSNLVETLPHLLITCPALENKRSMLKEMGRQKEKDGPLGSLLNEIFNQSPEKQTQFFLEPLTHPRIICFIQSEGNDIRDRICYFTRTFCFSLHRERQIKLDRWVGSGYPAPNNR